MVGAIWSRQPPELYIDPQHLVLDANYEENKDLVGKPPPVEGEMDLGDLRFGSVMFDEVMFDEKDPSDRNQVSAINQQNAGSVGMAQMLRTDMNPVLSDNTVLPETVVTLTVNATDRDDVNRRLRPLVAMHRRMTFNLVRNADLARMMLGLGLTANTADRLERLYEVHEKGQDFGLRFLMVQSMTTRSARLSRTIRTFKKEINQAELLYQTANVYDLAPDSFSEFGELGHVSPLLLSGTREYNEIMLGIRSTASAFQKVTSKIAGRVESGRSRFPTRSSATRSRRAPWASARRPPA